MQLATSWHVGGRQEGRREATGAVVLRRRRRRLGEPPPLASRIDILPDEQVEHLVDARLDFGTTADFERWLAARLG
jgi:hypothetical protein